MTTVEEVVHRVLSTDAAVVRRAVTQAIPDSEPKRYLYDLVAAHQARAGKGFRASLCLATCRAFGGTTEDAIDAAVALELLHSAFLVHDDIEDHSLLRRGQLALHQTHGIGLALNAGDGLCALALSALARCATRHPPEVGVGLLCEVAHLMRRTVEGQAWELGWIAEQKFDLTEKDYFDMVLGKTCWYSTIHPCRLGALIGSKGKAKLDDLVPFGIYMGTAFQIRDDIDNVLPADRYEKDSGGDIIEGKRTIPLLHLLSHCPDSQRRELELLIAGADATPPAVRIERVRRWMLEAGSLTYARDVADSFARLALREVPKAYAEAVSTVDVDYVSALVLYLAGAIPRTVPAAESVAS